MLHGTTPTTRAASRQQVMRDTLISPKEAQPCHCCQRALAAQSSPAAGQGRARERGARSPRARPHSHGPPVPVSRPGRAGEAVVVSEPVSCRVVSCRVVPCPVPQCPRPPPTSTFAAGKCSTPSAHARPAAGAPRWLFIASDVT